MRRLWRAWMMVLLSASPAAAQLSISGYNVTADSQERLGDDHIILRGSVELERTSDQSKLYAEQVEFFEKEERAIATGNVVYTQGRNTIGADRADFNTRTRLGTFYNATGIANVQPQRQNRSRTIAAPQMAGQETDVYFFGDEVEKIGAKKYRISNGGFSTCVQPTPRWDLTADTIILNIDHYTFMRQAMLKVKGVPMLYLPVMWYPTKEEGRATGFLLPTYGSSTIRGQAISNAFFWAIDRSQDATFMHDWMSSAGNGVGSEYRYNFGSGDGNIRGYLLNQRTATNTDGSRAPSRSYEFRGNATQQFSRNLRMRGSVDYFSSLEVAQTFNTNIYDASRNQRTYGLNLVGAWRTYSLNATFDRRETYWDRYNSVVTGNTPRILFTRNERPIGESPLYFSLGTEFVQFARGNRGFDGATGTEVFTDTGLGRVDLAPQIRYPFKKFQWFTVNTFLSWRNTYYTRSQADEDGPFGPAPPVILEDDVNRSAFTLQAQAVGPVFNKVWDTPENGYAEKFKHSIEPFFNVQRTTSVNNFDRIIQTDGIDGLVGNTGLTYGIRNRFYAKRKMGRTSQAQEIVNLELTQAYNTNDRATLYDRQFNTTLFGPPSNFTPIMFNARVSPWPELNGTLRAEIDSQKYELRTISANGSYNWSSRLQTTVGWSQRYFIEDVQGFNDRNFLDHFVNVALNTQTRDNRYGAQYGFNYNVRDGLMMQQRLSGFYNAQCCGIAFEYQRYNFYNNWAPVPSDHRFFISVTLAGLGNFSPFNGGMSGMPR